jgi:hypothetical protein
MPLREEMSKRHRLLFYASWIILGLIQARFTELQDDEAYYWVYGHYLDWGYFDHPPMIGLLIKMGYSIIPNELGVRLFPLLLNVLSLVLIEKLTAKKNPFLFYAIAMSIAVLQLTGFVAVPDIPLIFFTALFFWCYRKFVQRGSLLNSVILGVAIALLCYSKYHAALIVIFTIVSNPKLLSRYQAWIAVIVALILFSPHLWWQYQHDWVSIRYHLFESNVNAYKVSFTLEYIIGQLLLPGPVAGFILLPAAMKYKPKDLTERALRFTMIGIYVFFLLSSFRGKVEANWTSPALIPLFVLSHQYLYDKLQWKKWLLRLLPLTFALVLVARVVMIEDILPVQAIRERYHAWKEWPAEMKQRTNNLPIVFSNSYQRASKYWFYSGQPTYSLNSYRERKNNYNLWSLEDSLLGKPVYYLDKYDLWKYQDSMKTPIGYVGYRYVPVFASFAKISFITNQKSYHIRRGESLNITATILSPKRYALFIESHQELPLKVTLALFNKSGWIKEDSISTPLPVLLQRPFSIQWNPNVATGEYYLRYSIKNGIDNGTHNSDKIKLVVE